MCRVHPSFRRPLRSGRLLSVFGFLFAIFFSCVSRVTLSLCAVALFPNSVGHGTLWVLNNIILFPRNVSCAIVVDLIFVCVCNWVFRVGIFFRVYFNWTDGFFKIFTFHRLQMIQISFTLFGVIVFSFDRAYFFLSINVFIFLRRIVYQMSFWFLYVTQFSINWNLNEIFDRNHPLNFRRSWNQIKITDICWQYKTNVLAIQIRIICANSKTKHNEQLRYLDFVSSRSISRSNLINSESRRFFYSIFSPYILSFISLSNECVRLTEMRYPNWKDQLHFHHWFSDVPPVVRVFAIKAYDVPHK